MCQPQYKSAILKNLRPKASSKKANTTLTVFSQLPDFSLDRNFGNMARSVNGVAKPMPKPNMERRGIIRFAPPLVLNPTSAPPKIGPVQENETSTVVKAMKKGAINPPWSALASDLLIIQLGSVISNSPKNERAKIRNITKKIRLGIQCVEILYMASGPNRSVRIAPNMAKMKMMDPPNIQAWRMPLCLFSSPAPCMKKLMVIGISGKTHGVSNAAKPAAMAIKNTAHRDMLFFASVSSSAVMTASCSPLSSSATDETSAVLSVTFSSVSETSSWAACGTPFTGISNSSPTITHLPSMQACASTEALRMKSFSLFTFIFWVKTTGDLSK